MPAVYDPVPPAAEEPPRRRWLVWLGVPLLCFLLGLGAMGWLLSRWEAGARVLGIAPEPPSVVMAAPQPETTAPTPQRAAPAVAPSGQTPIVIDPEIARRVAALEQRLGQVGSEARTASGDADRAEGLLVAFAARRAIDRGVSLGFLEALLRQRFGESQPQAVGMIIAAAREPVTLQELQVGLQEIGPALIGAGPEQGWWDAFMVELGSLITVRRENTPSPEPAERLRRATSRLEAGQAEVALAEVLRMPGREHGRDWIMRARRYVTARRALDAIETAALVEPRLAPAQAQAAPPAQAQPAPAAAPVGNQAR
ncbi:hypothetical protein [Sphingosinicella sp.]|uniref:hypothetical protein n=1 Tax=Sphingosinicella sp. TaxID=1917971 RepID=UPI00403825AF